MAAMSSVNESAPYRWAVRQMRNYLAGSATKEDLNAKFAIFFRLASHFFFKNGPRNRQKRHVIEKLEFYKGHILSGERVLDVGCFDGYYTQQLREYGCSVVGVDSLDLVLNLTKKLDPEGTYVRAFGESLPFADSSFDVGLYSHVIHHMLDPRKAIKEARRVIRPGGKIIVAVPLRLSIEPNHLRSFNQEQLDELVGEYFPNVVYYGHIGKGHGCIAT